MLGVKKVLHPCHECDWYSWASTNIGDAMKNDEVVDGTIIVVSATIVTECKNLMQPER